MPKAPRGPLSSVPKPLRSLRKGSERPGCAALILGTCAAGRHWLRRTYNEMAVVRGTFVRVMSAGPASHGVSLSFYLARAVDVQIPLSGTSHACILLLI